ncbi:hypothetical protein DIPPA_03913 [Diplonema papillatum]|nr:hypothetical protein DIPPA_19494 [Diplonema papillatum]KAJ9448200.1 hypothetical protein DIPPA_03913 [Diplonema papillatum]
MCSLGGRTSRSGSRRSGGPADTLPGEETAAFFDGGSRGNRTNGAVPGTGAVFYDKGVKQWEVEKPIAGRATNNVAEYVGFVSVLARLLRDPVPPTPRTIVVKGDSELVIGQIKGTKRCNETLRRYYDQAQNLLAKLHDRRTTIEPVHIPRELNKDADELSNRAMDTAQRQAAQAYSDSATAKGWAMRTALSRLGKIARVKAVHPALEMRVNHLTSLGGPILQGLNKRPQINNREAFEAVMRAFEVAAVRHVPKKMANKGRGDQSGHWEKAGVLTGSFRPQAPQFGKRGLGKGVRARPIQCPRTALGLCRHLFFPPFFPRACSFCFNADGPGLFRTPPVPPCAPVSRRILQLCLHGDSAVRGIGDGSMPEIGPEDLRASSTHAPTAVDDLFAHICPELCCLTPLFKKAGEKRGKPPLFFPTSPVFKAGYKYEKPSWRAIGTALTTEPCHGAQG